MAKETAHRWPFLRQSPSSQLVRIINEPTTAASWFRTPCYKWRRFEANLVHGDTLFYGKGVDELPLHSLLSELIQESCIDLIKDLLAPHYIRLREG